MKTILVRGLFGNIEARSPFPQHTKLIHPSMGNLDIDSFRGMDAPVDRASKRGMSGALYRMGHF